MKLFPSEEDFHDQEFGIVRSIVVVATTAAIAFFMVWAVTKPFAMRLLGSILEILIMLAGMTVAGCVISGFPYRRIVSAPDWTKIVVFILLLSGVGISLISLTRSHQFVRVLQQMDQHREDRDDDE